MAVRTIHSQSKGFTLIELLVVIAIIGLVSSIVLVNVKNARSLANDAKRISGVRQLMTALELYRLANGSYPISVGCGGGTGVYCNSVKSLEDGHWIRNLGVKNVLAPFIAAEPIDPTQGSSIAGSPPYPYNGGTFYYFGSGSWYMIILGLENYPHPLEEQDGASMCDGGEPLDIGNGSDGIITLGGSCT
jgi:prepilin-type N-terminal cleavage/methylation domain-containing protein